jgi:D-alanyl-D-alanine endopeptidase (penicillin-binding protein 7)
MHANIKLVAVGAALGFTLYTTLLHGTPAMEPIGAPAAAAEVDSGAPPVSVATPAEEEPTHLIKAAEIVRYANPNSLNLRSSVALILDEREGVTLYGHNTHAQRPIASLTKLMTAMVIFDAGLPLDELIEITRADRDTLKGTRSRLQYGSVFTRYDLLQAALGASDNRAAAALARTYPGGTDAMIQVMNATAQQLGMTQTRYTDASGLDSGNVSTAEDLAKLVLATAKHPLFRVLTTNASFSVTDLWNTSDVGFVNTNRLVRGESWEIGLSKTGYTADAGNCLVMQATIAQRPVIIVLLNSWGKLSRVGDSNRIRDWLLKTERKAQHLNNSVATNVRG